MLDDHAHVMQVKLCKANTRGVTPCRLALKTVEDRSDRLLTRGMASGDVKELLGGSWALSS